MDMKGLIFLKPGKRTLIKVPVPTPEHNQVLIKVMACGICGTDIHIFSGLYDAAFPLIPGHECSGEVVEIGSEVKNLKIGDRIVVDPNVPCGYCSFCQSGRIHLCKNLKPFGVFRDGGFAQYAVIEESNVLKIPDSLSFEEGALIEPVSCCIRGIQMARFKLGDTCLIHGAGAIGLLNMQLAKKAGASFVIISDPIPQRRALAKKLGADIVVDPQEGGINSRLKAILEDGPDVVMECAGKTLLVEQSVYQVKRGGIVVAFGCCPPNEYAKISPDYLNNNEITVCGSFNNPFTSHAAISVIMSGSIDVQSIISHVFPLSKYEEAFSMFGKDQAMKILILPNL